MLPVDCCFTRYNLHTLTLFFSCFPKLASHFYRNSHEDCKVSRSQTMWATYLASTNNISLHCSLSTYLNLSSSIFQATNAHIAQPVNFRRILLLLLPDTTRSLHHQHQTSISSCCSSNTSETTSTNQYINQHCL